MDILLDSLSGQFVADLINCGMSTASNHFSSPSSLIAT